MLVAKLAGCPAALCYQQGSGDASGGRDWKPLVHGAQRLAGEAGGAAGLAESGTAELEFELVGGLTVRRTNKARWVATGFLLAASSTSERPLASFEMLGTCPSDCFFASAPAEPVGTLPAASAAASSFADGSGEPPRRLSD